MRQCFEKPMDDRLQYAGSFVSSSKVVSWLTSWLAVSDHRIGIEAPAAIETTPGGAQEAQALIRIEGEGSPIVHSPGARLASVGFGTHARQRTNRQRGQEGGFRARLDHRQPVRFVRRRRSWRRFSGGQGNRAGEARRAENVVLEASALTIGDPDDGFVVSSCPHKIHRYSSTRFQEKPVGDSF